MARTDFEVHRDRRGAVLKVMPVAAALRKGGAIRGAKNGLGVVLDKDELAFKHVDELVLVAVPVPLAGPLAGGSVMMFTPKALSPPASPTRWRVRPMQASLNGAGYPVPTRTGTVAMSILGMVWLTRCGVRDRTFFGPKRPRLARRTCCRQERERA